MLVLTGKVPLYTTPERSHVQLVAEDKGTHAILGIKTKAKMYVFTRRFCCGLRSKFQNEAF